MQVAMKRNVIRRRLIEPKSHADNNSDPRDGGVQSVDRALLIIETLAEDDEGYRLSDLSVRTGLSTSTVHRLLTTLEKRRFVQFDRDESMWHIGAQSFAIGSTFLRRRNFLTQALPYLRKLRDQTRETANLAVVDDGESRSNPGRKPGNHTIRDQGRWSGPDGRFWARQGSALDLF